MVETVRDFIDTLGGNSAVAKATGVGAGAVALWVFRRKLPRSAWPEVMKAFPAVTLDRLLALEAASGANDPSPQEQAA